MTSRARRPRTSSTVCTSSLGYALPGAIGMAYADPDAPVIAFITDGSLLMAAGALECAARPRLPTTYVHLSNGTLGWIKALQHLYFGGRYFNTDITRVDATLIARRLGVDSCHADSSGELTQAVRRGVAVAAPNLIDVTVPAEPRAAHRCDAAR